MPTWMWLNIPLLVLVFGAVVGVAYWLVLKHPDPDQEASMNAATPTPATTPEAAPGMARVPAQARRDVRDDREQRSPVTTGRR